MKRVKLTDNFYLDEFVSKETYNKYNPSVLKRMVQPMVMPAQRLRDKLGLPIKINDWATGGDFQYSGLREIDCPEGVLYSGHKNGNVIDAKCSDMQKLFSLAKKEKGVKRIEDLKHTLIWLHIEFGKNNGKPIIFNP